MTFIQNILKQVFPRPESITSGKDPVVSGSLVRNRKFMDRYSEWVEKGKAINLSAILQKSYFDIQVYEQPRINMGIYQENGIEGLYIRDNKLMSKDEFHYLIDFLKENVLNLNYRMYHAITDSREERGMIRTREEYYFKPAIMNMEYPLEQEYGNITLELNLINEKVQFLKIAATTYAGFNYSDPKPFHELVTNLLPET